ncbi:MAG: hypothetical protein OEP52_06780 [Acidimicrobiia bacterium]|nr:hypothetical protein [Acidimicrobiia bacterium]
MRRITTVGLTLALILGSAVPALAGGPPRDEDGNRMRVVVYVESQDLYFDSIVGPDLPMQGNFQELKPGDAPNGGLATEFGPGDPGYLGGRWWVDVDGDGSMNEGDRFFSCPLLGHGSATPDAP